MIVLGADTHKRSHTIAGVGAATGELVGERTVQVGRAGFGGLLSWARELGDERVWALEDCRHVSGSVERFLIERGERVLRIPTNLMAETRKSSRARGKSDGIDAVSVARAALREGLAAFPAAHLDGPELDLRLLVDHRERMVSHRVELNNTLRWHLHDLWPELELPGGALCSKKWDTRIAWRLARAEQTLRVRTARDELRRLCEPNDTIKALAREITRLVEQIAPQLLAEPGFGPLIAAKLIGEIAGAQRFAHRGQARPRGRRRAHPCQLGQHPPPAPGPRRQPPTRSRTRISPGIHGATPHPDNHNHSPPPWTPAPAQISNCARPSRRLVAAQVRNGSQVRVALRRAGAERSDLLQHAGDVGHRPVFDDLPIADAVDRNSLRFDGLVRRGDPKQLSLVNTAAHDEADHEVAFGDLQNDLVTAGRRDSKYLGRLLHSFAVQADARNRGVVRDEVLGDVLIEHVPVAGLVVVDRLQIAADQVLVRLRGHSPRLLAQVAPGRYSANSVERSRSGAVSPDALGVVARSPLSTVT